MTCTKSILLIAVFVLIISCNWKVPQSDEGIVSTVSNNDSFPAKKDSSVLRIPNELTHKVDSFKNDNAQNRDTAVLPTSVEIGVKKVHPNELMTFAETLMGVPYVWGATNPAVGFDCSGFITHVFNRYNIRVPRSSIDFTNVGKAIPVEQAKRGDIILFTGTNPAERHVGHMGLVVSNSDTLKFIHSTSGKAMGVTVTPLSSYYQTRFVKTIRIFPQNN